MPNRSNTITTNNKPASTQVVSHTTIKFEDLWNSYPSGLIKHPDNKTGKDVFDDHCAINVSQSLYNCGILLKSFKGTKCWACPSKDSSGKGIHAIRAQELSTYLSTRPFAGCPAPQRFMGATYEAAVKGKKGIIFFKDYWQRQGENDRTGDHIDLWSENKLASIGGALTFIRQTFPNMSENLLDMSDLRRASEVLFWEIA
ncbi:T6SS effector amidase Tae4 family protein [Pseudomonas sp.]|uniref:T6SS effector amidase Tae4 family protein n=1 Tax=Pseudomonas sp. TaxID=306 RepID=UPI00262B5D7A|nr:T6SS effector amidase Tae4 family protein [Pseudomonas sp.]